MAAAAPALYRLFVLVVRGRYVLLWLWTALLVKLFARYGADWLYFAWGSDVLFGRHPAGFPKPGGLHMYANYPIAFHEGPLSFVAAAVVRAVSGGGSQTPILLISAAGPVLVLLVERAALVVRRLRDPLDEPLLPLTTLVGGGVFLLAWMRIGPTYAHLDEAMVLLGAAVVVWCVATRHPILAGVALGLSIGALSWAVLLFPLLACFPRRSALRATSIAIALGAAAWLPFLVADTGTIDALRASLGNAPDSGLRVLGIHSQQSPDWLRPVQVALALALGTLAVLRRRWTAVLLVAVAARIALDPSTYNYYTAALVLGGLVWDLAGPWRPLPVWSVSTYFALEVLPYLVDDPHARGVARVAVAAAAIAAVFATRSSARSQPT